MTLLEQSTVLVFDPDGMQNTTISLNGRVLYNVTTEHSGWKTSSHIRTAEDAEVASLQFRGIGLPSTKVKLSNKKPLSLGSWLHKSVLPWKNEVTFKDDSGIQYKWKGNAPGQSLQLFLAQDSSPHPVAYFKRSTRVWELGQVTETPATLVLTPRAAEIRDLVVASFVFLERERRVAEISGASRRVADIGAIASTGFVLSTTLGCS